VEIMNPDQHIATLDKNGELNMEIYVDNGRGYLSVEANEDVKQAPGIIPIDAIFSPVRKVNYRVEHILVPEQTADFDRLILEVWTDGSISAKDAVEQASDILVKHLNIFIDFDEAYIEEDQGANDELEKRRNYLSKPVAELELSVRAANCLAAADIITIRDLVTKTEPEMLKYRNFGRKSLNEIKAILNDMGLSFGMVLDSSDGVINVVKASLKEAEDDLEDEDDEDFEDIESEESEDAS
jgi:DNA-directed RNA polymerase subunit alpha